MKSKFTPKRVFWSLMIFSALWLFFAGRGADAGTSGATTQGVTGRMEGSLRSTTDLLLTPLSWGLNLVQTAANRTVLSFTSGNSKENVDVLKEQIRALENNNVHLTARVAEAEQLLAQVRHIYRIGLGPKDVLPATITGRSGDMGKAYISIDKGALDGVPENAVVMSNLSPIGRVVGKPGAKTALVQLTTDVGFRVQARILRQVSGGYDVRVPLCLVQGAGNGWMRIDTVNSQTVTLPPERGDLVVLADPAWPAFLHSTVLGEVQEVGKKDNQNLRYDLQVRPREGVAGLSAVVVVLRTK